MPNQNKFVIGSLVRFNGNQDVVWKVVEIWDIAYVASVTNKINKSNLYVITNVVGNKALVAEEANLSPIEVKDEEKVEATETKVEEAKA